MSFSMFLIQQCQMSSGPHGPIFLSCNVTVYLFANNDGMQKTQNHQTSVMAMFLAKEIFKKNTSVCSKSTAWNNCLYYIFRMVSPQTSTAQVLFSKY